MEDNYTDLELLEQMSQEKMSAFEVLYNRYAGDMFVYALNIFKKREVCEDIIQDVFIDFWSRRNSLHIKNPKGYLFQSVKYQIFNHMRQQKISSVDLMRLNIEDLSMNIVQKMEVSDLEHFINCQVAQLPERCRQIFVLSRYDQKSNKEIAVELGITNQAVKNQVCKAMRFIKNNLEVGEIAATFLT